MGNRKDYLINAIVEVCGKLDRKGWVANHDGNVSLKYEGNLLATPTAESKGDIRPEMVLTLDMEGKKLQGIGKPFSEIKLHLAAYRAREDVQAVVHAHPPYSMARGLVGGDYEIQVPEAVVSIGDVIPVMPYVYPGVPENDAVIAEALAVCDVFMMAGNGVLSVGRDLKEAYLRMELLEHLLKIDSYASVMGTVKPIPAEDRRKLLDKRASIGLGPKPVNPPEDFKPVPATAPEAVQKPLIQTDALKELIAAEIKKALQTV